MLAPLKIRPNSLQAGLRLKSVCLVKRSVVKVIRSRNSQTDKNYSTVTDVVTCCLQAGLRLKSVGLVQRLATNWRCSAFIA